jgi:phage gp29-like protein
MDKPRRVTYWLCSRPSHTHHHKTKEEAEACIAELAELDLDEPHPTKGWTPTALKKILAANEAGWTQKQIADKLKLRHAQEVGALLEKARGKG